MTTSRMPFSNKEAQMLMFLAGAGVVIYFGGAVATAFLMALAGGVRWWESILITLFWPLVLAYGKLRSHGWED